MKVQNIGHQGSKPNKIDTSGPPPRKVIPEEGDGDVIRMAREVIEKEGFYIATKKDIPILGDVASDAYTGCPLHMWLFNGTYDRDGSTKIFTSTVAGVFKDSIIYGPDESLKGFAIWIKPGFSGSRFAPFILNGGLSLLANNKLSIYRKLVKYEVYVMDLKNGYTDNMDWYLFNLSVRRSSQGKGIASKLVRPMLRFIDSLGDMSYLETSDPKNIEIYKRYGYRLAQEDYLLGTHVRHCCMVRAPKSPNPVH